MKKSTSNSQNVRIISLAKHALTLPFVVLARLFGLPAQLVRRFQPRSDKDLRADDQLRQSRARRQLRGLSADHVQHTSAAVAAVAPPETSAR